MITERKRFKQTLKELDKILFKITTSLTLANSFVNLEFFVVAFQHFKFISHQIIIHIFRNLSEIYDLFCVSKYIFSKFGSFSVVILNTFFQTLKFLIFDKNNNESCSKNDQHQQNWTWYEQHKIWEWNKVLLRRLNFPCFNTLISCQDEAVLTITDILWAGTVVIEMQTLKVVLTYFSDHHHGKTFIFMNNWSWVRAVTFSCKQVTFTVPQSSLTLTRVPSKIY